MQFKSLLDVNQATFQMIFIYFQLDKCNEYLHVVFSFQLESFSYAQLIWNENHKSCNNNSLKFVYLTQDKCVDSTVVVVAIINFEQLKFHLCKIELCVI